MPRRWDPAELHVSRGTAGESSRLARYAARLLAATATATAMTALVATATAGALVDPVRQAAADGAPSPPAAADPRDPRPGSDSAGGLPPSPPASPPGSSPGSPGTPSATGPGTTSPGSALRDGGALVGDPVAPDDPAAPVPPGDGPAPEDQPLRLTDDAAGQPLFQGPALAPGGRVVRCITVLYTGSLPEVDVRMAVEAAGPLASWLRLDVAAGSATDRACTGFTGSTVTGGTLSALTAGDGFVLVRARAGEPFGVRLTTTLPRDVPADVAGSGASGRFVWSTEG